MARCMLCSSTVADDAVICPLCGGAVEHEHDGADATRVQGPAGVDLGKGTGAAGGGTDAGGTDGTSVDLGKAEGPPPAPEAPPEAPWGAGTYPGFTYGPPAAGYGAPPSAYGYGPHSPHGYGYPPGWTPPPPPMPQEGMAMGSFLTSLIGLVLSAACFVPILACPVGAVLGHIALRRIERTGNQGRGLALAGVIIGWIGTAILVIATAVIVAVVATGA